MQNTPTAGAKAVFSPDVLQALIGVLARQGYTVLGPSVRDGAIIYDEIASLEDLPAGWTDRQEAGRYGLERREDGALFGYAVGPQSWKRFLHPPAETLWTAHKTEDGFSIAPANEAAPKLAFLGVRACELSAIAIQDRVFCEGPYPRRSLRHAARERFYYCCELQRRRWELLLRIHAIGPQGRIRLRLEPDRAFGREARTSSWWRRAAKPAPRSLLCCRMSLPRRSTSPPPKLCSSGLQAKWAAASIPMASRNCSRPI